MPKGAQFFFSTFLFFFLFFFPFLVFAALFFMAKKFEWDTHYGGGSRATSRRWGPRRPGDRKTGAERIYRMRKSRTDKENAMERAVLVARRVLRDGCRPASRRPRVFRPGQKVNYNPLGLTLVMKGTVIRLWKSPAHCRAQYGETLVIVKRDKRCCVSKRYFVRMNLVCKTHKAGNIPKSRD
jgi:hypothetical protein